MREAWLTLLTSIPAAQTLGVWGACVVYITFGITLYVASHSRKQQSTSVCFSNAYCHILISSTFIMDMKMTFLRNLLLHEISVEVLLVWCYKEALLEMIQTRVVKLSMSILDAIPIDFCQSTIN